MGRVFLDANVLLSAAWRSGAAIDGGATHLLTGDREHFGPFFRQEIAGVTILPPAEYPPMTAEG